MPDEVIHLQEFTTAGYGKVVYCGPADAADVRRSPDVAKVTCHECLWFALDESNCRTQQLLGRAAYLIGGKTLYSTEHD